jgi:hypothetical protein
MNAACVLRCERDWEWMIWLGGYKMICDTKGDAKVAFARVCILDTEVI